MMLYPKRPRDDRKLVQIVDVALATAAQRAGEWLVCHSGCNQCCNGVFAISQLDAARLREGVRELKSSDPERASRIQHRAVASLERLAPDFPGDQTSGILGGSDADCERFEEFGNDEPCPALDPATGMCDVYAWRPMTCRVFGPPVRTEGGLGTCELCFHGATDQQIAACEMIPDPDNLEEKLLQKFPPSVRGQQTIVAYILAETAVQS